MDNDTTIIDVAMAEVADAPNDDAPLSPPIPKDARARQKRITELMIQRAALDREIAWLSLELGEDGRPWRTCQRCGYKWQSRSHIPPSICAGCHAYSWQKPRRVVKGRVPVDTPNKPIRRKPYVKLVDKLKAELKRRFPEGAVDPFPPEAAVAVGLPPLPPPPSLSTTVTTPEVFDVPPSPSADAPPDPLEDILARHMPRTDFPAPVDGEPIRDEDVEPQ